MSSRLFVGQRLVRTEDPRFLSGRGCYVDDVVVPNTLHVAFARSDVARGKIVSIDTSEAEAMPGVVAVYTAADLNHLPKDHLVDGEAHVGDPRPFRILADGDVRSVGEPYAMVVAESRYVAEDAVEAIVVDIDPEPGVYSVEAAMADGAPIVHSEFASNLYNVRPFPENPELDSLFESAPVTLTETFGQHRYLTVPMETRGILAHWDPFREQLTVWNATQSAAGIRSMMARLLGIEDSRVRAIMPDVGGSFGLKMNPAQEDLAVVLATHLLGRPVKWTQDRRENLMADDHPREDYATVSFAADEEGHILAAKVDFTEGAGAFPAAMSSASVLSAMIFPAPYKIPQFATATKTVYTNQVGRGSYRGPWMYESVCREQMMDCLASHMGMDPLELRRRNVLQQSDLPTALATGFPIDEVTPAECLELAAEMIGYDEFREQQKQWREEGRLIGLGIGLFAEPTSMAFAWMTTDAAIVRIAQGGNIDVLTSAGSHGQSLETTIAQVVADEMSVDVSNIRVLQGDTDSTPIGAGTGGSRSAVIVGTAAIRAAHEVKERMIAIAAHALEASPDDMEVVDGRVQVKGTPTRGKTFAEISEIAYTLPAMLPPGVPLGLEAQARFTPDGFCTWSNACHMCIVEVDRDTGAVEIKRYIVAEDCGVMINPNVVEGQVAGGVVQGIGGVLYENAAYDDQGNPLATTFVDYLLPTAAEAPEIEYGHIETRASSNPGGHKGLGEGGAIGSPPCVINAVADALAPLGVKVRYQPLGPADVVELMEAVGA